MVRFLSLLACLVLPSLGIGQEDKKDSGALSIQLIALRDQYAWEAPPKLKPGEGRPEPMPSHVALAVELTNRTKGYLHLYGPPGPSWILEDKDGKKVKSHEADHFFVAPHSEWTLKAGETLRLPVSELSFVKDRTRFILAWPGPGTYRLQAEYVLGVSPAPEGAVPFPAEYRAEGAAKFGTVRLVSSAVKVEVVEGNPRDYWVKALADRSREVRAAALVALKKGRGSEKELLPGVAGFLKDEDAKFRLLALETLTALKKEARPALLDILPLFKDRDPLVRKTAARSLAAIAPDDGAARLALSRLLEDPLAEVRRTAGDEMRILLYHNRTIEPELQAALLRALQKEADSPSRTYLIRALQYVPGEDVIEAVLPFMKDEAPAVNQSAMTTLASLCRELPHGKERPLVRKAVQEMALALKDKTKRDQAAWSLQYLVPEAEAALPTLIWALEDPDSFSDSPNTIRVNLVRTIGTIGPAAEKAAPALVHALHKDPNWQVRAFAADALSKLGPAGAKHVPDLVRALKDEMDQVRGAAAEALGKLGPRSAEAVPHLLHTLKTSSLAKTRASAAFALHLIGMKGRKTAVPLLAEALTDLDPQVCISVAIALGQIGPDAAEALPLLRRLARDPRLTDRTHIENAIQSIEGR